MKVKDLNEGDKLRLYDGNEVSIDKIEYIEGVYEVFNFEVEEYHTYYVSNAEVLVHNSGPCNWTPKSMPKAGSKLSSSAKFNRGSRNFELEQGNASSGWKHIYDRHIDPSRFPKKSKFDPDLSENDIKGLLNKTLKHGKESTYDGLPVFEYRAKINGKYKKYRATVNTDGTVRTFHPLDQ